VRIDPTANGGRWAPAYFRTGQNRRSRKEWLSTLLNLRCQPWGLYAWSSKRGSRELKVRVEGQLVFNTTTQMLYAAALRSGLTYEPEGLWCNPYHKGRPQAVPRTGALRIRVPPLLPSRRQPSSLHCG